MGLLNDKVAVVIGASSGFGEALAHHFVAEGAKVVVAARRLDKLGELAKSIGALPVACDITDDAQVGALAAAAVDAFGRIDIAVNSAGFEEQVRIRDLSPEKLEPMVRVQFLGGVYFIRHMAGAMEKTGGGSIVTISSLTATLVPESYASYAGSKAAINHVTRIAAAEYGPANIRVNVVSPSIVETPMTAHLLAIPAVKAAFLEETPLGRLGTCEDVCHAVTWLASEGATYMTGQNIIIDGGAALRRLPDEKQIMRLMMEGAG